MLLENKVAMVTGAARGIGRAIALVLAEEGADVGVADVKWSKFDGERYYAVPRRESDPEEEEVRTDEAIERLGRKAHSVEMDVSDSAQVKEGVESVRNELGRIDILVNNAGIVTNIRPLADMERASWDHELAVNLSGAFNCSKEVLPGMVENGWGRVINISSGAALGGIHRQAGYAASKAGVLGFTKSVTLEYAALGITCNAVMPGMAESPLVRAMPKEIREEQMRLIPAGRFADTREIAYMVAFLASDRAAYINGVEIHVNGGGHLTPGTLASRKGK